MAQVRRGCAPAFFIIVLGVLSTAGYFGWRWYKSSQPSASGGELAVHVLDVGPIDGDSILIVGPEDSKTKKRKAALIDAGDTGKGKVVLDALKRYGIEKLDYFIATHAHPDHLGGADEVLKATSITTVIDSGVPPPTAVSDDEATTAKGKKAAPRKLPAGKELPTVKSYQEFLETVKLNGAQYVKAEPGQTYDLGGGAIITILAPTEPFFTRDQMKGGGNEPNANSVVARLDYGSFSMLLPGDAEAVTEDRMINKDVNLGVKVLKVAHHGSKYATSDNFLKRVKPEVAIISTGEWNRYGHPAQAVMDRLKAAGVKVYRTDLQGEITITTKGKGYEIKTGKEAAGDLWAGREAQKDDSASRGFIAYGDFGPPPKPPKEKTTTKGKK